MLYDAAHGGTINEENSKRLVAWYKWQKHSKKTWEEARAHYWALGGKLSAAVNGATEHVDFLAAKWGSRHFGPESTLKILLYGRILKETQLLLIISSFGKKTNQMCVRKMLRG